MQIHHFILALIIIFLASTNFWHFLVKRREKKNEIQIYFMSLFIIFIINGIIGIVESILDQDNRDIAMGISVLFVIFLLAAGLSLQQELKWSRILVIGFGSISFIYLLGSIFGLFTKWNLSDPLYTSMVILCAVTSLLGTFVLFYFYYKTRLSALFGLFLGILIPTIFFITGSMIYRPLLNEIAESYLFIIVNIIMYFGFKEKFNFFQKEQ